MSERTRASGALDLDSLASVCTCAPASQGPVDTATKKHGVCTSKSLPMTKQSVHQLLGTYRVFGKG